LPLRGAGRADGAGAPRHVGVAGRCGCGLRRVACPGAAGLAPCAAAAAGRRAERGAGDRGGRRDEAAVRRGRLLPGGRPRRRGPPHRGRGRARPAPVRPAPGGLRPYAMADVTSSAGALAVSDATEDDAPDLAALHAAVAADMTARYGKGPWSYALTEGVIAS